MYVANVHSYKRQKYGEVVSETTEFMSGPAPRSMRGKAPEVAERLSALPAQNAAYILIYCTDVHLARASVSAVFNNTDGCQGLLPPPRAHAPSTNTLTRGAEPRAPSQSAISLHVRMLRTCYYALEDGGEPG